MQKTHTLKAAHLLTIWLADWLAGGKTEQLARAANMQTCCIMKHSVPAGISKVHVCTSFH
jgi:hypothetical protein